MKIPEITPGTVALTAGAVVAGFAIGYRIASRRSKRDAFTFKSWKSNDPLMKYIHENSLRLTPEQDKLLKATIASPRSGMLSDHIQIQMLQLICKALGSKKTLDIGVFTGYSSLSIALVLPDDGKVIACDVTDTFAQIGMPLWKEAGVDHKIDLRIAPATETLQKLIDNGESGTFDYAYIDADKENYHNYVELCAKLLRKGGIIALDNTLWSGAVADPSVTDVYTEALRNVTKALHKDDRFDVSLLTVGDGTTLCLLR